MKFDYIDSIRGVAVLMVVLLHTSQQFTHLSFPLELLSSYGQMGVQLFFLASAFTLSLSASNRINENRPLLKYSIRRYFRSAPLYYFGIILYFPLKVIVSEIQNKPEIVKEIYTVNNVLSNLLFMNGFYPQGNNNVVPGGWSIGTEMAFYVVFPILFYLLKDKLKSKVNIIIFILCGFFISQIAVYLYLDGASMENNTFEYFNLINQLPVFFVGIGYFFWSYNMKKKWHYLFDILLFILFTSFALLMWVFDDGYCFTVIPFISAISFIFLIEIFRKVKKLNHKILISIGKVSYAIYIVHFIFANYFLGFLTSRFSFLDNHLFFVISFFAVVAFSYFLAKILERCIETPGINYGKKIIYTLE